MAVVAKNTWQVQEAKQRFSELVERARNEGPQVVTRHGREVAVVLDIERYRQLSGEKMDFKEFLLTMPDIPDEYLERPLEYPREVEL